MPLGGFGVQSLGHLRLAAVPAKGARGSDRAAEASAAPLFGQLCGSENPAAAGSGS